MRDPRRLLRLLFLLLLLTPLASCGKKNPPTPPIGAPQTYPQTYPHEES